MLVLPDELIARIKSSEIKVLANGALRNFEYGVEAVNLLADLNKLSALVRYNGVLGFRQWAFNSLTKSLLSERTN